MFIAYDGANSRLINDILTVIKHIQSPSPKENHDGKREVEKGVEVNDKVKLDFSSEDAAMTNLHQFSMPLPNSRRKPLLASPLWLFTVTSSHIYSIYSRIHLSLPLSTPYISLVFSCKKFDLTKKSISKNLVTSIYSNVNQYIKN